MDFVCEIVLHALKQPRFQTTPDSQSAMNDLLIASKVKAALAQMSQIRLGYLNVISKDGNVFIIGRSRSQEISDSVIEIAGSVPGVKKVEVHVDVDYRSFSIE